MNKLMSFLMLIGLNACIDPIAFDSKEPAQLIIVEGSITDDPGPYTVKISRALPLIADTTRSNPLSGAKVRLYGDDGEHEDFTEKVPGEYQTGGAIRGQVGRSYHITLQMPDGSTFESTEEKIRPSGAVTNISIQYEARTVKKTYGVLPADVFNIFIDGNAVPSDDGPSYVRWRYTGTYKVESRPELHVTFLQASAYMTPVPCSGYVVEPSLGGGKLVQKEPCTCCVCYCTVFETEPQLSDTERVADGQFRNVKVGEVPITNATFHDKYRVEIEQMSISDEAFQFFKLVRNQKQGAANLFQPPPGEVRGNIKPVNASYAIVGMFWATSVDRKAIFVHQSDVPYRLTPIDEKTNSCFTTFPNATTQKPANWDE